MADETKITKEEYEAQIESNVAEGLAEKRAKAKARYGKYMESNPVRLLIRKTSGVKLGEKVVHEMEVKEDLRVIAKANPNKHKPAAPKK